MEILFVTDYVCPYCLVAKVALEEVLKEAGVEATIRTQPFELTPEPKERVDTCHDENRKKRWQVLVEPAKELGLSMKLPPMVCPRPYTRLAFEGWYFAEEHGLGDEYSDLVYRAYFEKEQDIGDLKILTEIAQQAGLDPEAYRQALLAGTYTEKEKEAVRYSREVLKVDSVPTLYVDKKRVHPGGCSKEDMFQMLAKCQEESQSMPQGGFGCGEGGCG